MLIYIKKKIKHTFYGIFNALSEKNTEKKNFEFYSKKIIR